MYYDFYRLKENPFNVTADPNFYYESKSHQEALSNLTYGIQHRKGILMLTGEIGTGKTTLCRRLLNDMHKDIHCALISNPSFSNADLLQAILSDLDIPFTKKGRFGLTESINQFLIDETQNGKNVVLVVDEAQNMSPSQLEQIRLLSNLETEKEKLLQVILTGQPELREKIKLPALRQLRQRISVHYHLAPLTLEEMRYYIQFRMDKACVAGTNTTTLFTSCAFLAIFQSSRGFPRIVNILCDRALTAGFSKGLTTIDGNIIRNCAKEVLYCEHYS